MAQPSITNGESKFPPKTALIVEGGAMRGAWAAGVLAFLHERGHQLLFRKGFLPGEIHAIPRLRLHGIEEHRGAGERPLEVVVFRPRARRHARQGERGEAQRGAGDGTRGVHGEDVSGNE